MWSFELLSSYIGAPTDGSTVTSGDCRIRVIRGGAMTGSRRTSVRPTASGPLPTFGATSSDSGSGGRLPLNSLPLYVLGSRRSPGLDF
jgi:hypothetical protein